MGNYMDEFLGTNTPAEKSNDIVVKSKLINEFKVPENLKQFEKSKDPLIMAAKVLMPKYNKAVEEMSVINSRVRELEEKVIAANFKIRGTMSPPDATFSLRISDGIVKGYSYNGTMASFKTTYFGLYERFTANDGNEPWSLPQKWLNPPIELLGSPLNFVGTFDTIGGNSGSPVINRNREYVGLNFDSNIDRLPIRSILYDPEYGRSVGVHAGGITAALKYIYKADRLLSELGVDN
jgi:hypothetical protein